VLIELVSVNDVSTSTKDLAVFSISSGDRSTRACENKKRPYMRM
jgi:hypothetical protein